MSSVAPPSDRWDLRLWPGLVLVAVVAFGLFVPVRVAPQSRFHFIGFVGGPVLGTLLGILWWTTFARTSRPERVWVPLLFFLPSLAVAGLDAAGGDIPPMLPLVFGLPFVLALWVGWLALSASLTRPIRLTGLAVLMTCGWVAVALVRLDGTDGDMMPGIALRFGQRAEDLAKKKLGERGLASKVRPLRETVEPTLDWAEFRGPNRDSSLSGVKINADWEKHPPKLLWKQEIGPGWGSFAAVGDRLFTQEQRGDDELIVCYAAATGEEIWRHAEPEKFYEQIAQAGPRATPTYSDGRIYAQGATGVLVCLNAEDGKLVWKINIKDGTGGVVPQWGYASSPLVLGGKVIVYTGGPGGKGTSAFDTATGKLVWSAGKATHGYSSAQRVSVAGVEQVLMLSDIGLESFDPGTGKVLWEFPWVMKGMNRVTQPTVLGDGEFLIGAGVQVLGTKRVKVTYTADTWKAEEVWFTRKVHPYFNDGVIFAGHYYGYASKSLVCMSLTDGRVLWDAGAKYGHGQVLLLRDSGLLLVQAADGKVYLVKATPDEHVEEARLDALDGKTWNHPIVNRGRLFVRNGAWAAAYQLTTE